MLYQLLNAGYLPQELPKLFTSCNFAAFVKSQQNKLPEVFTAATAKWTDATHHNAARVGGLRRRLSIPNPVNYFRLAQAFKASSSVLHQHWAKSEYSFTTPELQLPGNRAIAPRNIDRASPRALARVGARYLLRADIAQFYPSIYTHSITWALHSKSAGKAKTKDSTLVGNILDRELQAAQSGQTKGIPIGPDTSLGIAEVLLSQIDFEISENAKPLAGVRFIDDIELSFTKLADAEEALATLEASLHAYELQLNASKTRIIELPDIFDSRYVTELRTNVPPSGLNARSPWIDYFNRAFELAQIYPSEGVMRYAVATLQHSRAHKNQWELVQALLWQSIASDPGCLRFVIDVLLVNIHSTSGLALNKQFATDAINSLILRSAPVEHGSEVVWGIWAALLFKIKLSEESFLKCANMSDSFVATIVHIALEKKAFVSSHPLSKWSGWIHEGCFEEANWFFVYEAFRRGWMKAEVKNAKIDSHPVCKAMKAGGVTFIDDLQIVKYAKQKKKAVFSISTAGY